MPEIFFTPEQKVEIANYLAKMGVHSIDAGFPICSKEERKAVKAVAENSKGLIKPIITTLCRAKAEDIDASYNCLKSLSKIRGGVSIFLGSSPEHRKKLRKTKKEILEMTTYSIKYAQKYFDIISFSPEDASRTELDFLVELYNEAIKSGASNIGFTDTVGILTPNETKEKINYINKNTNGIEDVLFAIHFHNNLGLAVANSLAAIETGYVNIFQGTIGGIGEGSGNAPIEPVVVALNLKNYKKKTKIKTHMLQGAADLVERLSNLKFNPYTPIIGKNVFRTEAGIHQDGILKSPDTYEIFPPEYIGVKERKFIIGKHSGRNAIFTKLKELGYKINEEDRDKKEKIYNAIKDYCDTHGPISNSKLLKIVEQENE